MAILAASTNPLPVTRLSRSSLILYLDPILDSALGRQASSISVANAALIWRWGYLFGRAAWYLWLGSRVAWVCGYFTTQYFCQTACALASRAARTTWNCKMAQRVRKKFLFEFMVLILGPSGNALVLAVFWPGWVVLIGLVCAAALWKG